MGDRPEIPKAEDCGLAMKSHGCLNTSGLGASSQEAKDCMVSDMEFQTFANILM